jgi:radical SAM protein with 4Fe4S-binding SPASM domain
MRDNSFRYYKQKILTAPVTVNLELTSDCNMKCRHCYNFWREDNSITKDRLTKDKMDKLIDIMVRDKIFHVVLSGGEPFLRFDVLEYALRRLHENNISTTVNSNLTLATSEKIDRLKAVGLDHILTSLNSYDSKVNDYMTSTNGSFKKIIEGTKTATTHGIRVSVNMIISELNKDHVYKTAELCSVLGVQRIFGTRLVPSVNVESPESTEFNISKTDSLKAINELLRAKKDFGIAIGTLISYPLCLLGDMEKYRDFVGRGCAAQRGNRMVINANGETHACTHGIESYGNVFEIGIKEAFRRMRKWHNGSYFFSECSDCEYINICNSGCRYAAYTYYKRMDGKDPLFSGRHSIKVPYKITVPKEIIQAIDSGGAFIVPDRIRFRQEEGFYSINVRWANSFTINTKLAEFLIHKQKTGEQITLNNMIGDNPRDMLAQLIFKEALIPLDQVLRKSFEEGIKLGCSVDPGDIPQ